MEVNDEIAMMEDGQQEQALQLEETGVWIVVPVDFDIRDDDDVYRKDDDVIDERVRELLDNPATYGSVLGTEPTPALDETPGVIVWIPGLVDLRDDDDVYEVDKTLPDKKTQALLDDPKGFGSPLGLAPAAPEVDLPGVIVWVPGVIDVRDNNEAYRVTTTLPDERVRALLDNPADFGNVVGIEPAPPEVNVPGVIVWVPGLVTVHDDDSIYEVIDVLPDESVTDELDDPARFQGGVGAQPVPGTWLEGPGVWVPDPATLDTDGDDDYEVIRVLPDDEVKGELDNPCRFVGAV